MGKSNFIDYVNIFFSSGNGGAGSHHFRREKYEPQGGPDGGDGGRGGHIILIGNNQLWTLLHLKYKKHIKAPHGKHGGKSRSTGKQGADIIVEVPTGTVVRNKETGEQLCEITQPGQKIILFEGGMGGLGNQHFKSSTNQIPQYAQPGIPGKEAWCILELKLLADVGFVGFPNAGKSTLLSVLSAAKPEIADYPFTTLVPQLGLVRYYEDKSYVVADIPGIIEGASEGKGLGLQFLRHIERNAVLLFVIPADSPDVANEYDVLVNELQRYNPEMVLKTRVLGISKCDLLDDELMEELRQEIESRVKDTESVFFSSQSNLNITSLKDKLYQAIQSN